MQRNTTCAANARGTVVEESDYYPFGGERVITDTVDNNYKFTSQERDGETGLDYFIARHYSSGLARFLQTDPAMIQGSKFLYCQQWNLYSYTRNNPLKFVDPTGEILELLGDEERKL